MLNKLINPKIIPRLKMLLPTTLPTEIEGWFFNAAETVTANSGAEVAIATTVNPITRSDKPNFFAIREAESTIQEAPNHKPMIVTVIIKKSKKIDSPVNYLGKKDNETIIILNQSYNSFNKLKKF